MLQGHRGRPRGSASRDTLRPVYRFLYPLLAVAILTARAVAKRTPAYRPVVALLAGTLAANAAQAALRWAIEGARLPGEHYGWPAVAAFAVERSVFIGYPFAVLALAAWALARHRGWAPLALWLGFSVAMALTYAGDPPDPPTPLYELAQQVVAAGCVLLGAGWAVLRKPSTAPGRILGVEPLAMAALILGCGEMLMLAGPFILGRPVEHWDRVLCARGPAWTGLVVLQVALCKRG